MVRLKISCAVGLVLILLGTGLAVIAPSAPGLAIDGTDVTVSALLVLLGSVVVVLALFRPTVELVVRTWRR